MTTGEFRNDQPPLPGLDSVSLALGAFCAEQAALEENDRKVFLSDTQVHPIQRVIVEAYEREVVRPREQAWSDAKSVLGVHLPTGLEVERGITGQYPNGLGKFHWEFSRLDAEQGLNVRTKAWAFFDLGAPSAGCFESDLKGAVNYMGAGKTAFKKGKIPDELLGVAAEGRGSGRHFPAELRDHVLLEGLERADALHVRVQATYLGTGATKDVFDFKASRPVFEPETWGTSDNFFYLCPENVDSIYDLLWYGHSDVAQKLITDLSLDDVYNFLHTKYIKPGPGEDYINLAAVANLIQQSDLVIPE